MFPAMGFLTRPRACLTIIQNPDAFIQVLHDSLEDRPPLLSLGAMTSKLSEEGFGEFTPRDVSIPQDEQCLDFSEAELQMLQGLNESNSRQGFMIVKTKSPTAPVAGTDKVKLLIVPNGPERHTGSFRNISNFHWFVFVTHEIEFRAYLYIRKMLILCQGTPCASPGRFEGCSHFQFLLLSQKTACLQPIRPVRHLCCLKNEGLGLRSEREGF